MFFLRNALKSLYKKPSIAGLYGTAIIALLAFLPHALNAQTKTQENTTTSQENKQPQGEVKETLDDLYLRLKQEANPASAAIIARSIIEHIKKTPNKTIELLMDWTQIAHRERKDYGKALDLLDQITTLDPNYPEGWNQRATLYFEQGKLGLSLKDVERTLALEPRHFGALSGLALILERIGYPKRAEKAWKAVLDIYPANRNAQASYARLLEENAGTQH